MNYSPPSLQQLCVRTVIDTHKLIDLLSPWVNDWEKDDFPRNDRLTRDEEIFFLMLAAKGKLSLTECKNALRSMLYRRPCELDLLHLRTLPYFRNMTDFCLREIWADTVILDWESFVPTHLECQIVWERMVMTWPIYNNLYDGFTNKWLFEVLAREKRLLVKMDEDEARLAQEKRDIKAWKKTVGREWLHDMRFIINYACILFL